MLTPALILGPQAGACRSEAPAALGVVAEAAEAWRRLSNGEAQDLAFPREGPAAEKAHGNPGPTPRGPVTHVM